MKFKVCDPSQVRLYEDGEFRRVSDIVRQEKALAGIDAGFYSGLWSKHPKGSIPVGQLMFNDVNIRTPADMSAEGVKDAHFHAIYKKGGKVIIDKSIPYPEPGKPVEWGIKMGPRLLQEGEICKESINDPRWDVNRQACPRVAIGVKADDRVVFAYDAQTTPKQMAFSLLELGCVEALGCDGDSSASYVDTETGDSVGYKQMPNCFLMMPSRTEEEQPSAPLPPKVKYKKIYISPSQQPENLGVGDYGTEQRRMFELGWLVASYLSRLGYEVKISRPGMTLTEIIRESDAWGADYHLVLHSNAFGGKGKGVVGLHWPGSIYGEKATRAICEALALFNPNGLGRVSAEGQWQEIADPDAYCVYLEVGFHDRPEEAAWIVRDMDLIARLIAGALSAN